MKAFYDADANVDLIRQKKVAIIGYGSQGHAHALNLKDSGVHVTVGLRKDSKSRARAEAEGLRVVDPIEASNWADVIMMLVPDELAPEIYEKEIAPGLKPGKFFAVRARLRSPLQEDPAAEGRRRVPRRAEGAGSYGASRIRERARRPDAHRGPPGSRGQRA